MSKILITGGHLTPAQAFISWLSKHHPEEEVIYVGREYAQVATGQKSWERAKMEELGIEFIPFDGQKTGSFNPFTFPATVETAGQIIDTRGVDTVLSFGGYLGVPFALAAKKRNLTLITHEQTCVLGRANRLIGLLADHTAVSLPHTKVPFYIQKTTLTGNPLRSELWDETASRPDWFTPTQAKPILYVAGGSQGAQPINDLLAPIIEQLDPDYIIVHQVGRASSTNDPQGKMESFLEGHHIVTHNYYCREFLSEEELAYFYPRINFAVSRAGANTVAELTAFQIPTLFIPLPQANYREQERNALSIADIGAALCRSQKTLSPLELLSLIRELELRQDELAAKLATLERAQDAPAKIYELILTARRSHQVKIDPHSPAAKKTFTPPKRPALTHVISEDL